MSRRSVQGMRAIVTGASSGIGRELALELARGGARQVLLARTAEKLRDLQSEIEALGGQAVVVAGDVASADIRQRALDAASEHFGGLDLLVNNAGVSAQGDFASESPDVTRQIFDVNFFAPVELAREAIPLLRRGNSPMIVNVGSILGDRAIPFSSAYCASKAALKGWNDSLRAELASDGIDVLLVAPGTTDTGFFDHLVENRVEMPWSLRKGVAADKVARASVKAIEAGSEKIVPSFRGWTLLALNRLMPGVLNRIMARYARKASPENDNNS